VTVEWKVGLVHKKEYFCIPLRLMRVIACACFALGHVQMPILRPQASRYPRAAALLEGLGLAGLDTLDSGAIIMNLMRGSNYA